jgi:hypothetical protein
VKEGRDTHLGAPNYGPIIAPGVYTRLSYVCNHEDTAKANGRVATKFAILGQCMISLKRQQYAMSGGKQKGRAPKSDRLSA